MAVRILVNDDEAAIVQALKTLLLREGYEVETTRRSEDALALLEEHDFQLLITDIVMRPMDGIELLKAAKEIRPRLAVIMITGFASVETAVDAMKYGAFDYICKPFRIDDLVLTVQRALAYESALAENESLREALRVKYHFRELVGDSFGMRQVYQMLENLANTTDTVLIQGEDGTEKELVAKALHVHGKRVGSPFVTIVCDDLEEDELAKNLFGSGGSGSATVDQKSFLFAAQHGTAFLAEAQTIPLSLQHKLPHFLRKNRPCEKPTGKGTSFDVRLVLSSSEPLHEQVENGNFDADLHRLLDPVVITLPPLRERQQDMPMLTRHFLNRFEEKHQRFVTASSSVLELFERYPWPGNLQELARVLNKAANKCTSNVIEVEHLPVSLQQYARQEREADHEQPGTEYRWRSLNHFVKDKEAEYVKRIYAVCNQDAGRAADVLGISPEAFAAKLREAS